MGNIGCVNCKERSESVDMRRSDSVFSDAADNTDRAVMDQLMQKINENQYEHNCFASDYRITEYRITKVRVNRDTQ